jgi:hypothetical protein
MVGSYRRIANPKVGTKHLSYSRDITKKRNVILQIRHRCPKRVTHIKKMQKRGRESNWQH